MPTALITGASHGIGKEIAKLFASQSYDLVLNCMHSQAELECFSAQLQKDYSISCIVSIGNVGDASYIEALYQTAIAALKNIDVVINNAGISHIGLFHEMSIAQWQTILDTNLSSVFYSCQQAARHMIPKKQGRIINISSVWGEVGASCEAAYSASKGGVNSLTRALAKELAPSNIQVNAISCGAIDTRMNACFSAQERSALEEEIPSGRYGTPKEVAELAYQLATSTTYLTGQIIRLDGAWI